jgi:hypothetical protein
VEVPTLVDNRDWRIIGAPFVLPLSLMVRESGVSKEKAHAAQWSGPPGSAGVLESKKFRSVHGAVVTGAGG